MTQDIELPVFFFPWAIVFWAVYIWTFYIAEAGVISHTKETRGIGPERPQDCLASLLLLLLTLAAKIGALLLAWFGIGLLPPVVVWPSLFAGLALMLATALFVYIRRISSEELALPDAMGGRYRSYCAARKKNLPFIY